MSLVTTRAVFLDRDGVINHSVKRDGRPYPPGNISEFKYIDGIHDVLNIIANKGFQLYIVTNQPDVARGTTTKSVIDSFHSKILLDLPIRKIYTCYHDDADHCNCRKPLPGMLFQASLDFGVDLHSSFLVGDRWRDIDCGNNAGCTTIFVDYNYNEALKAQPDFTVMNLAEILNHIN